MQDALWRNQKANKNTIKLTYLQVQAFWEPKAAKIFLLHSIPFLAYSVRVPLKPKIQTPHAIFFIHCRIGLLTGLFSDNKQKLIIQLYSEEGISLSIYLKINLNV